MKAYFLGNKKVSSGKKWNIGGQSS
jgi:hypothetical protein